MIDKLCAELSLPPAVRSAAHAKAIAMNPANASPLEAATRSRTSWPAGYLLRINFLEGEQEVQQKVIFYAQRWCEYANIIFDFDYHPDAEIRITFKPGFSESYLGMDALSIPVNTATMNLWLTSSDSDEDYSHLVLHEFGHALGLIHEHQSPVAGINWNRDAVIRELTSPYYNCTKQYIELNYFERLTISQSQYTRFDPYSIMLYDIPARWTLDGFSTRKNIVLSATDKQFISRLYP